MFLYFSNFVVFFQNDCRGEVSRILPEDENWSAALPKKKRVRAGLIRLTSSLKPDFLSKPSCVCPELKRKALQVVIL